MDITKTEWEYHANDSLITIGNNKIFGHNFHVIITRKSLKKWLFGTTWQVKDEAILKHQLHNDVSSVAKRLSRKYLFHHKYLEVVIKSSINNDNRFGNSSEILEFFFLGITKWYSTMSVSNGGAYPLLVYCVICSKHICIMLIQYG